MSFTLTLLSAVVSSWLVMLLSAVVSARVVMNMTGEDGDSRSYKAVTVILMAMLSGMLVLFAWSACD